MKVTWIAPVVDSMTALAWLNELGRIQKINNVEVKTLTGNTVTLDDVAATLQAQSDVLVWSGHGTAGGLILSDGSLVRTNWLAAQVAFATSPRLAILAACSSQQRDTNLRSLTETICRSGITVIGFPANAGDIAAARFTIECIRALAIGSSVPKAFDVGLEAIADEPTAGGVFLYAGIRDYPFMLETCINTIEALLTKLVADSSRINSIPIQYFVSEATDGSKVSSIPTRRSTETVVEQVEEESPIASGIQPLTCRTCGHVAGLGQS